MNRRDFLSLSGTFASSVLLARCGGSPTAPTSTPTTSLLSRPFIPSLGGDVYKSFVVGADAPLYAAMQSVGITPGSSKIISSRDTRTGIVFNGNLVYYVITSDGQFQPENGFDFKINDREIFDPLSGAPLSFNFYEMPVYKGSTIALTLPPKWDGVSD